jgi:uroporphyrin-III C-methyltransferase
MTVHLVGAGPGDVELLTLKAARLLANADAVVFDRLVGPDVLDLIGPSAERYNVGKSPGRPGPSQAEINDLLCALGQRLQSVVRLKGGDPFMFGRGIEEQRACLAAGVDVSVVPGISSSIAAPAAAGVSITERGVASGVCVVTAHQDPESDRIDWDSLAKSGLTITVLMGAKRARRVAKALVAGGRSPDTAVVVVTNASRPEETQWSGTLATLGLQPVKSPSVLVIGDVAATAQQNLAVRPRTTVA